MKKAATRKQTPNYRDDSEVRTNLACPVQRSTYLDPSVCVPMHMARQIRPVLTVAATQMNELTGVNDLARELER